ncbi:30S ribosomal protein S20 [Eremococcus coleocola]|uniref:Small ribosomal subunit protein bS20 n=1 Tax=Eremococcus coleocola ACS-139-V-Col8 TaxID=908337 RepID=E4KNZ1_9LACT|nr:30S ribosomal protein S20 [Eremococcus coleocola]EFR31308.1 ribosomal protein S20 [Eremococcus coleocola ACS-139-V-Col8]
MANSAQATKRVRQNTTKRDLNKAQVSEMRTAIKNFKAAVESSADNAQELFNAAASKIDRAAKNGLIHGNKADRDKAKLNSLLNK